MTGGTDSYYTFCPPPPPGLTASPVGKGKDCTLPKLPARVIILHPTKSTYNKLGREAGGEI